MLSRVQSVIRSAILRIEAHNPTRTGHAERTSSYAVATAHELGLHENALLSVRVAAALHDIGRLLIPRDLLERPDAISSEERNQIRASSTLGAESVLRLGTENSLDFSDAALFIGQRFSPLVDQNLGAKVLHVCSAFDTMTTSQPWREAKPEEAAMTELEIHSSEFDPSVVAAFKKVQPLIVPITIR